MSRPPGPGVPDGRVSPHVPVARVTCLLLWAAALGATQPCALSLRYDRLTPVARVAGFAAWQGAPSWAVCRHARHQLLPWLRMAFVMVPDAAWPGSDPWPWSTAPANGLPGRLGRPNASDPEVLDRCVLSLCRPRCVCVCGVLAHLAPVHRCSRPLCFVRGVCRHVALVHQCVRCGWYACAGGGFVAAPLPPLFLRALWLFFSFLKVGRWVGIFGSSGCLL